MSTEFGSVPWSICQFALPLTMQGLGIASSVFSDFLHEIRKSQSKKIDEAQYLKVLLGQDGPKLRFLRFDKNFMISWVLFLLECESTGGLLTFSKDHMSLKNLILELWPKILETNQNAGFFKLHYLTNKSIYELEFLYVVRHPQRQQICIDILSGCGQACLVMPKVLSMGYG